MEIYAHLRQGWQIEIIDKGGKSAKCRQVAQEKNMVASAFSALARKSANVYITACHDFFKTDRKKFVHIAFFIKFTL